MTLQKSNIQLVIDGNVNARIYRGKIRGMIKLIFGHVFLALHNQLRLLLVLQAKFNGNNFNVSGMRIANGNRVTSASTYFTNSVTINNVTFR